jgi:hypothetical protein
MIGKIVKGRSFKGCISYVMDAKETKILASEGVLETDKESIINSFYIQRLLNPKLSKCVGHIPLAFSLEDSQRMTDQFMERIAKEYMQQMGTTNTQYLIVRHNNTAHPHCHIVFNRVDNNGKIISDKNDRYRNEKVCKQLKDKYNLTYGKGKENVNTQKLKGAEQTKYEIYHTVKNTFTKVKNWNQFEELLKNQEISIEYKRKEQTDMIQGVSFKKGDYSFKGSEVDRKFSYSKLDAILNENDHIQNQQVTISTEIKNTGSSLSENIVSGVADVLSSVGGLFDIQPSSQDEDEAEYLRQQALKKKKKPQKRRGISR